jgi:V8-like Glu-specific endopeptidase
MHPISRMTLHGAVTEFLPINPHSVLVIPPRLESDGNGAMANVFVKDAKFLRISDRWGASRATNASFNFGLITLEKPLTPNRGFWGTGKNRIAPLIDAELQDAVVHTIRYTDRGDFQPSVETRHFQENKNKTQWSAIGHISCVEKYTLSHDMPAFSGQAGAPIWIEQGEDRMLVGIATVGHQAVRITFDLLLQLREWMGRDGV